MTPINDCDPITLEKVQDIPQERRLFIDAPPCPPRRIDSATTTTRQANHNNIEHSEPCHNVGMRCYYPYPHNHTSTTITTPVQQLCKKKYFIFDSKVLAEYMFESYNLENPFNKIKFTRQEIERMDVLNKCHGHTNIQMAPLYDMCDQLQKAEVQRAQMVLYFKQKLMNTIEFICNYADFQNHSVHINFFKDYALSWVLHYQYRMISVGAKKSELDMAVKETKMILEAKRRNVKSNKLYLDFLQKPLELSVIGTAILMGKLKDTQGSKQEQNKQVKVLHTYVTETYAKAWETTKRIPEVFETYDIAQGTSIMHQLVFQNGKSQNPSVLFGLLQSFVSL